MGNRKSERKQIGRGNSKNIQHTHPKQEPPNGKDNPERGRRKEALSKIKRGKSKQNKKSTTKTTAPKNDKAENKKEPG